MLTPPARDVVRRIEAVGSDFDGATTTPFDVIRLSWMRQALPDQGLVPDDVARVLGGEVLRLL